MYQEDKISRCSALVTVLFSNVTSTQIVITLSSHWLLSVTGICVCFCCFFFYYFLFFLLYNSIFLKTLLTFQLMFKLTFFSLFSLLLSQWFMIRISTTSFNHYHLLTSLNLHLSLFSSTKQNIF